MTTKANEELEKIIIDLYESAMLHGEAQANSVLPTPPQRETVIVVAKQQILSLIAKQQIEARIDELNEVMGNLHDNRDCTTCYTNHTKLEKHYFTLKEQLKEKM